MAKKLPYFDLKSLRAPAAMQGVVNLLKAGSYKVSGFGAVAGAGIDIVSATRDERGFLSEIASEYRPEIAERAGLAENQVTEEHYQRAFADNPILAQAKEVAKMDSHIRAANTAIASSVGVLAGLVASSLSKPKPGTPGHEKGKDPSNIAGGVAATFGAAAAGKLARKLLHTDRLDKAMESTAHHKIMKIKEMQQRGEETTPADIFEVQLALNPDTAKSLRDTTGKPFAELEAEQKDALVRKEFPELYALNETMADRINRDGLRPQQLLFGEVPAAAKAPAFAPGHPDLPPNAMPREVQLVEASQAADAARQLSAEMPAPALPKEEFPPAPVVTPRSERPPEGLEGQEEPDAPQPNLAQRFTPQRPEAGFADRVEAQRQQEAAIAPQR